MGKIMILILGAFFLQIVLTIVQIKSYQKNLSQMMQKGKIIIGRQRGMLSSGCVIIIRIDDEFNVIESRYMKGVTVFNRFKKYDEINKKNIFEFKSWIDEIKNKKIKNAIINAIEIMQQKLNENQGEGVPN